MLYRCFISLFILVLAPLGVAAQEHHGSDPVAAPYAGLQTRAIKGLSEDDIAELRRGAGWGLALPAELNGVPGPAHLLELKDEIGLSDEQVAAIEAIYADMKAEAIAAGESFIAAEAALDQAFAEGRPSPGDLKSLIADAEAARAELRFIHLSRHLLTPPLLTDHQVELYKRLRGYTADPCASVPEGHDAEMWRRHNGCS